ncbi:MAG: 30S ribosomal protein S18 [Spirochaetales bacterium]|nr:30S ribosomal protein S18 [Spirochaetales bacterium]
MSDQEVEKKEEKEFKDRDMRDKDREGEGRFSSRQRGRPFFKKKVCKACIGKMKIDYKDAATLRKYVSERGKILPRRITGACAKHQRKIAQAIKRARAIATLPYVSQQG